MKKKLTIRFESKLAALLVIVALSGMAGLAAGVAAETGELREEFHHTYPLTSNGRVSLRNVAGIVRITGWDRNEVRVDAVKRAERRERLAEAEIKVESTNESIRIWTRYPDQGSNTDWDDKGRYDNSASVDYTISVPRGARLDSVELVGGYLDIIGVTGDVRASTVSGRFRATGLAGEARLSTVSSSLEATFDRISDPKTVTLNSVSGAIVLTLPSDVQAQVRANTLSGPITNDFGLEAQRGDYIGNELYGQIGNGGTQIKLNTVSGRITIQHANDGKTVSSAKSLLSQKRRTQIVGPRIRLAHPATEALSKAQRDVVIARMELLRAERVTNRTSQTRTVRAVSDAERSVAVARAELRTQTEGNSDRQRAAAQALADAEGKLAEARAELQRNQGVATEAQRQAISDAQRKLALAQTELQRVQSEQVIEIQERNRELQESRQEAQRIQRDIQIQIRNETRNKIRIQQGEIERQAREAARDAIRDSVGTIGSLRFRETESKTFTVGEKPRINIGSFDGRITMHAWDKNEVSYSLRKATWEENTLKGITVRSEQKGDEISIIANLEEAYVHRVAGVKSVNAYASIEVFAPRNATIHASTGEGGITVEGFTGEIDLRNSSGSIVVSDSKGHLTVNAGHSVRVSGFDGTVDARSGEGRVYLGGRFTQLSAQTNNQPIILTLSRDTNAIVETNSESVTNEGVETSEETGPAQRPRRFKFGRGGPLFILRSGTGRIILRRADGGPM